MNTWALLPKKTIHNQMRSIFGEFAGVPRILLIEL